MYRRRCRMAARYPRCPRCRSTGTTYTIGVAQPGARVAFGCANCVGIFMVRVHMPTGYVNRRVHRSAAQTFIR